MRSSEICRVYENKALREEEGGLIRPGGLEMTQRAVTLSSLRPGSLVLDIGCGTGAAMDYLTGRCALRAFGIDLSSLLLAQGHEKNPGLPLARASGADLPFADASVDAVLAECSLSVMDNVEKVLYECSRVLKHEGFLLVQDVYARRPDCGEGLSGLPVRCCLTGAVSRQQWAGRLERSGFAVLFWEDHSLALKEFAARLIFSHGSLETLWRRSSSTPEIEKGREIQCAVSSAKPGYFLAVAKKITGAANGVKP